MCRHVQLEAAELLVRHGASIGLAFAAGIGGLELFGRFFDGDGRLTALHWAVVRKQTGMVGFLAEQGANLALRDPQYNATALGWAEYHKPDRIALWTTQPRSHSGTASCRSSIRSRPT